MGVAVATHPCCSRHIHTENPFGDDPNDIDVFSRLRAANDDLADVLVFALGSHRVDRFDNFFTLHRMERRVAKRISAVEVKKDHTSLYVLAMSISL